MAVDSIAGVGNIRRMAKKKTGGDHKKKRTGVNIPEDWHALARKLARDQKQPVLWYIVSLLQAEAEKKGYEIPPPPWDEEAEGDKPKK